MSLKIKLKGKNFNYKQITSKLKSYHSFFIYHIFINLSLEPLDNNLLSDVNATAFTDS